MNLLTIFIRRILCAVLLLATATCVHAVDGKMFVFANYVSGKTVSANGGGTGPLSADNTNRGSFEQFDITVLTQRGLRDGARVRIRCNNSQFIAAEGGGGGDVNCNRNVGGTWETFTVFLANNDSGSGRPITSGRYVQFKAGNGNFLKTQSWLGTGIVVASGTQREKTAMFRIEFVDGHLPPLVDTILRMDAFPSSSFAVNPEQPLGHCSLEQGDADAIFAEDVPGRILVGILVTLDCSGSLNGTRIDPEYFKNFTLRNGWHVIEVFTPNTSTNGCNSYAISSPVIGSNSPYVKLHFGCPAFRGMAQNAVSVRVAGPQGWGMMQ